MTGLTGYRANLGHTKDEFSIGDVVRNGTDIATVTDVGTVLIAIRTAVGASRMVCPWELVRFGISPEFGLGAAVQWNC